MRSAPTPSASAAAKHVLVLGASTRRRRRGSPGRALGSRSCRPLGTPRHSSWRRPQARRPGCSGRGPCCQCARPATGRCRAARRSTCTNGQPHPARPTSPAKPPRKRPMNRRGVRAGPRPRTCRRWRPQRHQERHPRSRQGPGSGGSGRAPRATAPLERACSRAPHQARRVPLPLVARCAIVDWNGRGGPKLHPTSADGVVWSHTPGNLTPKNRTGGSAKSPGAGNDEGIDPPGLLV